MNHFIVRALGAVAGAVVAAGVSAAGIASATGDDEAAAPGVTTSTVNNAQPAAAPLDSDKAPAGGCHLVFANIFGPVCLPGR